MDCGGKLDAYPSGPCQTHTARKIVAVLSVGFRTGRIVNACMICSWFLVDGAQKPISTLLVYSSQYVLIRKSCWLLRVNKHQSCRALPASCIISIRSAGKRAAVYSTLLVLIPPRAYLHARNTPHVFTAFVVCIYSEGYTCTKYKSTTTTDLPF